MLIFEYNKLYDLAHQLLVLRRSEMMELFMLRNDHPLFCKGMNILRRDVRSIVYKVMISEGLFPINCETNTMNDSYLKLKLLNTVVDQEVLPWSAKFHASISISDFHYSFTPNDLFNLRTLK